MNPTERKKTHSDAMPQDRVRPRRREFRLQHVLDHGQRNRSDGADQADPAQAIRGAIQDLRRQLVRDRVRSFECVWTMLVEFS